MDAAYGSDASLRRGTRDLGLTYSAAVWARTLVDGGADKMKAEELAAGLPKRAWKTVTWRQGVAEPLRSRFARVRVRARGEGCRREEPEEWLLIEWPKGETAPTKYWLSTLPENIAFDRLVDITMMRWRIERDYQDLLKRCLCGSDSTLNFWIALWFGAAPAQLLKNVWRAYPVIEVFATAGGTETLLALDPWPNPNLAAEADNVTGNALRNLLRVTLRERALAGDLLIAHRAGARIVVEEATDAQQENFCARIFVREPHAVFENLLLGFAAQRVFVRAAIGSLDPARPVGVWHVST